MFVPIIVVSSQQIQKQRKMNIITKPTYKQQFDKLTEAYINFKVEPYTACKCFCGNLLNGTSEWYTYGRGVDRGVVTTKEPVLRKAQASINEQSGGLYTVVEILNLENMFLETYEENTVQHRRTFGMMVIDESALFIAFDKTLDYLKEIHRNHGEDVDTELRLSKRQYPLDVQDCI